MQNDSADLLLTILWEGAFVQESLAGTWCPGQALVRTFLFVDS